MDKDPNDIWNKKRNQKPPNLDELLKKFFNRNSGGKKTNNGLPKYLALIIVVLLIVVWFFFGFFTVPAGHEAVILRFGQYSTSYDPGLHWLPKGVEKSLVVDKNTIRTLNLSTGTKNIERMITRDKNFVNVELSIEYNVDDPRSYLFSVEDPEQTLRNASASAIREIMGRYKFNAAIKDKIPEIREEILKQLNIIINRYKIGVYIVKVNIKNAVPDEIMDDYKDVIVATEQKAQKIQDARRYENRIKNQKAGQGQAEIQKAEGIKGSLENIAYGEVAEYKNLLKVYEGNIQFTSGDLLDKPFDGNMKILSWKVSEGDSIDVGDLLFVVSNDKNPGEKITIKSPIHGTIQKISLDNGSTFDNTSTNILSIRLMGDHHKEILTYRMYTETMEKVLEKTKKIIVSDDGKNINLLPLDKIMEKGA